MRNSLLFFLLFKIAVSYGQSDSCDRIVEGQILDLNSNEPLPYATIKVVGTELGAIADENGGFVIEGICQDEIDLEIRYVGYKSIVHHHDYHHPVPSIYLASEETLLESVVVEEDLNVHDLKTISSKEIKLGALDGSGQSAGEILAQTTGVSLLKTGQNITKPIVHGLHSNRVLIINNGVRHAYQAWGTEHGPEIDPTQIDRIQLVKGASTVRYGSQALGGVILFDAPSPTYNTQIGGEVNGGFQTNGRAYNGELSLQQGFERAAWRASISGIKQGDLTAPNYQLTNTGKREWGATLAGKLHFPSVDIDIYASRFNQELGILVGSIGEGFQDLIVAFDAEVPNGTGPFSYEINNPNQQVRHDLIRLKTSLFVGEQQFDVQYAFQKNLRKEFDVRRGNLNAQPSINLQLTSHALDIDWDHPSKGVWSGTYGIQLFTENNDNIFGTGTTPFIPNYNTYNAGIFGIESYTSGNTVFEAGIRYDFMNLNVRGRDVFGDIFRNDQNFQNFSLTLGMIKQLNESTSFRSNIGTAWRPPNIGELYSFGRHQSILQYGIYRYNTDLEVINEVLTEEDKLVKNEQGIKWISTLELRKENWELEATPYVNYILNYFFIRPFGLRGSRRGTLPYFLIEQTDAFYSGIDIDIKKNWDSFYQAEIKASYVYARDIKNNGSFIGIPPLNIQAELKRKLGDFSISINPEWTARQSNEPPVVTPQEIFDAPEIPFEQNETFDLKEAPNGFFLLGSTIEYEKRDLKVRVKGTNLLNTSFRRYTDFLRYYADDPGVNFAVHVSYKF